MRIGRIGFLAGHSLIVACFFLVAPLAAQRPFHIHPDLFERIGQLALVFASVVLTTLRCHDCNRTLWGNFWTDQVPLVGPFLALYDLVAIPGSVGMNDYGMPPRL